MVASHSDGETSGAKRPMEDGCGHETSPDTPHKQAVMPVAKFEAFWVSNGGFLRPSHYPPNCSIKTEAQDPA